MEMQNMVKRCKRDAEEEASGMGPGTASSKRRRLSAFEDSHLDFPNFSNSELENSCKFSPSSLEKVPSPEVSDNFGVEFSGDLCSTFCSDQRTASRSSSNYASAVVKERKRVVDLEAIGSETENWPCINNKLSIETKQAKAVCGDSEEMESAATPSAADHQRRIPAEKIPPQAEIEEFFAKAEEYERKGFAEKYNYDIVRDVPLEGRFEWVPLKP